MKLFLYYALHSVKNQIKKLCRSWFIIFFICCILLGAIIGIGAGLIAEHFSGDEDIPAEEEPGEIEEIEEINAEQVKKILCTAVCAITLVVFLSNFIMADKSGASVFTMPDVNLLFAAPMKPQSVLLFKLMNQILLMVAASVYLVFQIPNLVVHVGLDALTVISVFAAWIFILIYGKLINVFVFTLTSTKTNLKRFIRPTAYALIAVLALSFLAFYKTGSDTLPGAVLSFFGNTATRYIPIYGWIKGMVMWSAEGNALMFAVSLVLLVLGVVALAFGAWRIKADFYEEAMAKSQETAELLSASTEGSTAKRKKDRSEKLERDGLNRGSGANIFFFKSLYNRFRFAHFKFFTKTSETYLVISVGVVLISIFAKIDIDFTWLGIGFCALVFFRSLGNPMAQDMSKDYLITVPATSHSKVFWSLAAGTVDCALDILPAFIVSAIFLKANILTVISLFVLCIAVDFYASNVMLFIELSLPSSLALQVKQAISIMFIYFGLIPIAAVIIAGLFLDMISLFVVIASVAALGIGALFFAFSPLLLERGRK